MNSQHREIYLPGNGTKRVLKCCVLQSPLAGVSDSIFRSLVRRWAPEALLFTEMVNATSFELGYGQCKVDGLSEDTGPIGVQLVDYRPAAIAEAAKKAEGAGAYLVDINMGCPVRKISCKGSGSGLLLKPDLAAKIVNSVTNAVKIPVTVKTRLGWSKEQSDPIDFALRLEESGAQMITLHGRTRNQGFSGKANWEAIAKVKEKLSIPLIANGDISSITDAWQCLNTTKADGIMLGRGTMGAPWLVGQIHCALTGQPVFDTPGPIEKIKLAREQLERLVEVKGSHGLLIARKHMNWTCKDFSGAKELRSSLVRAKTVAEAFSLMDNYLCILEQN